MNLLVLLPGRVMYYHDSTCTQISFSVPFDTNKFNILESFESDLAINKKPPDIGGFNLLTENLPEPEFWKMVYDHSSRSDGLLIHQYTGVVFPVEFLQTQGQEWCTTFPVHYLNEHPGNYKIKRSISKKSRYLLVVNPGEPELKYTGHEALGIMDILSANCSTRIIQRKLTEFEYYEALADCDCLLYFGHAKYMQGHPVIELGSGWTPMFPGVVSGQLSLLVLGACLETRGQVLNVDADCCLFPNCRIADRKSSYLADFITGLLETDNASQALLLANRKDKAKHDVRRLVYRVQGSF